MALLYLTLCKLVICQLASTFTGWLALVLGEKTFLTILFVLLSSLSSTHNLDYVLFYMFVTFLYQIFGMFLCLDIVFFLLRFLSHQICNLRYGQQQEYSLAAFFVLHHRIIGVSYAVLYIPLECFYLLCYWIRIDLYSIYSPFFIKPDWVVFSVLI